LWLYPVRIAHSHGPKHSAGRSPLNSVSYGMASRFHVVGHALKSNLLLQGLGWGIFGQEGLI